MRTCLEPKVPLHVDDETAGLEAGQPLNRLHVVDHEIELLAGVCAQNLSEWLNYLFQKIYMNKKCQKI
jgi:hypothetical protein